MGVSADVCLHGGDRQRGSQAGRPRMGVVGLHPEPLNTLCSCQHTACAMHMPLAPHALPTAPPKQISQPCPRPVKSINRSTISHPLPLPGLHMADSTLCPGPLQTTIASCLAASGTPCPPNWWVALGFRPRCTVCVFAVGWFAVLGYRANLEPARLIHAVGQAVSDRAERYGL